MKNQINKDLFDLQENYQTEPGERQVDLEVVIEENTPEPYKLYSLTEISKGKTWKQAEVK